MTSRAPGSRAPGSRAPGPAAGRLPHPPGLVVLVLVLLALAGLGRYGGAVLPEFFLVLMPTLLFWLAQSTSWNLLSGFTGYFSFGQGAYVGLGAYTTAVLAGRHQVSFWLTLPVSAALSALLALVIGGLAFRLRSLRGEIFALLTLAVPFILAAVARISRAVDGGQGIPVPVPALPAWVGDFQTFLFLLNLAIAGFAVVTAYLVQHSRFGWALTAIRDAEDVAEGLGVATFRYKMQAIVLSGVIGGLAGSAFALQIGFVTVDTAFSLTIPLFVIVMSVLGGRTHWLGPVIGTFLIVTLQDRLSTAGLESWEPIILGAVLALLVVIAPDGLYARLRARPWLALATLAMVTAGLAAAGVWGEFLDWLLVGALCAATAALWPRRRTAAPAGLAPVAASAVPAYPPEPVTVAAEPVTVPAGLSEQNRTDPVLVECTHVARYFGGVHAVEDIDLTIRRGELVGLVGPNGSGKTTLVNLLSGTLRAGRGTIRVAGQDITGLAPHRVAHAGMARTYQIPRPFMSMTVRDNVAMALMFGRDPHRLAAARAAADRHLVTVALDRFASAYPSALNLHQRQLLELARAIATDPRVLVLDEVLAGLNPAEIDNAVQVIRRIHRSGITIVIVEHLLRVLNQLATRIVVLDRGTCLADGPPQVVMSDPAVVSAYLGRPAHA